MTLERLQYDYDKASSMIELLPSSSSLKKIKIISVASTRYVVNSYAQLIITLQKYYEVQHMGISLDTWYNPFASKAYESYNIKVRLLPRSSGKKTTWWKTENISVEFNHSKENLASFLNFIIDEEKPDLLLIADISGPLEKLILYIFCEREIPICYLEHGYFVDPCKLFTFTERLKFALVIFRRNLIELCLLNKRKSLYKKCRDNLYIFLYSKYSKDTLINEGYNRNRIYCTGFPYFDILFIKNKSIENNHKFSNIKNNKIKILFISTGNELFGTTEDLYFKLIQKISMETSLLCEFSLRLKPGELIQPSLNNLIALQKIKLDDNTIDLTLSVTDYDLVVTQSASLSFLESFLLGTPTIVYKDCINQTDIYIKTIDPIIINDGMAIEEIDSLILSSLNIEYLAKLQRRFMENKQLLICNYDGLICERIAEVIKSFYCNV